MDKADLLELWSAVGFDTPDAAGNLGASRTQLQLAIDAFDVSGSIAQAVDAGYLDEQTVTDSHGVTHKVGYRLSLGSQQ